MTIERVFEIRGFGQVGTENITLLPIETIQPLLNEISIWLKKYEGGVNYRRVKVEDFNFQPYVSEAWGWGPGKLTEIYCAIENKTQPSKNMTSLVRLWAGPRNDYWVIVAELTALG